MLFATFVKKSSAAMLVFAGVLVLILAAPAGAQTKICDPAGCTFEWSAPADLTGITEYRFYAAQISGGHDFDTPLVTVPVGTLEAVGGGLAAGTWYAVVTASDGTNQSLPSNEVKFIQPLASGQEPTNLIIKITHLTDADGNDKLFVEIERIACTGCTGENMLSFQGR